MPLLTLKNFAMGEIVFSNSTSSMLCNAFSTNPASCNRYLAFGPENDQDDKNGKIKAFKMFLGKTDAACPTLNFVSEIIWQAV